VWPLIPIGFLEWDSLARNRTQVSKLSAFNDTSRSK
jgi:hypothetical protein